MKSKGGDKTNVKWDRLDNTAHLFPVIANESMSSVYRISVTLSEEVDKELLQEALNRVLPFFDIFNSRMRKGFFWYYFERTDDLKRTLHDLDEIDKKYGFTEADVNAGTITDAETVNKWRKEMPDLNYVNLYGSSEIAGICLYYEIKKEDVFADTDSLPMGKTLSNCKIVLVDQESGKAITERNTSGEIYLSSKALAKEYVNLIERILKNEQH